MWRAVTLQRLKHALDYHLGRDLAVGGFGYDERVGAFYHVVGNDETAAHRQTVHELAVVGHSHVSSIDGPRHVFAQDLSIVGSVGHTWATPVLRIHKVGTLKRLHLVILNASIAHKLGVKLIAVGMCHHKVDIGSIHPFGKRVRHSLRQRAAMGSP